MGKKNKKKNKIAGINIGNKLGSGEIKKIAAAKGISVAQVAAKAANKGIKLSPAAKNVVSPPPPPPPPPSPSSSPSPTYGGSTSDYSQISYGEYDLLGSTLSASVQNQGLADVERIRQAGATERLKYEVDNRIPEIEAQSSGRIDLQKIINAGEKSIARIQRGSDMVRNITSMFNF